ncbi:hypothetical protein, partial [Moorena sp. SIO3I8]|uniref:hypothetical protein n=1 Tax=Moorena sp. SIO3I8 TaxID=2607833 RepID=UPI0025FE9C3A
MPAPESWPSGRFCPFAWEHKSESRLRVHNKAPQFQKSRAAAAIALGNLGDKRAIPLLKD